MTDPVPKKDEKKEKKKDETWAEFFKRMALPIKSPRDRPTNVNARKVAKKVDK